jgi:hypothetical protein
MIEQLFPSHDPGGYVQIILSFNFCTDWRTSCDVPSSNNGTQATKYNTNHDQIG